MDELDDGAFAEDEAADWVEDQLEDQLEEGLEAECGRWDQNAQGGMHPVGLCRLAGTEWCDWECPYSR
jgi:hypothetical protein